MNSGDELVPVPQHVEDDDGYQHHACEPACQGQARTAGIRDQFHRHITNPVEIPGESGLDLGHVGDRQVDAQVCLHPGHEVSCGPIEESGDCANKGSYLLL